MGYSTEFSGQFTVTPPLKDEHAAYLTAFAGSRRVKRNAKLVAKLADPVRKAAHLGIGLEGGYYVGAAQDGNFGQTESQDIVEYNHPPKGQPGLWCHWVSNEDGTAIEWDGGEKFYSYKDWILYLIHNFLARWGYRLDGEVTWQGEDMMDRGVMVITNNLLTAEVAGDKPNSPKAAKDSSGLEMKKLKEEVAALQAERDRLKTVITDLNQKNAELQRKMNEAAAAFRLLARFAEDT